MIKTLLKKQMMEVFSFFWQDKKKNRKRTGKGLLFAVILYLILFGMLAAIFYGAASMLCRPLLDAGMGWLYFALMGLIGIVMGVFGSVFNTYAGLYTAKDNSLLLAMPVKPSYILLVRLSGVYAMGLLYELLVMLPVLLKYYIVARPGFATVTGSVVVTFALSVFILTLSAVLGWAVALVSCKTKNKSMITVVLSLAFIVGYYYVYGKAVGLLQEIATQPQIAGEYIKGRFLPLYHLGMASEGHLVSLCMVAGSIFLIFAVVYLILEKTYIKIVTTDKGEAKVKYKEKHMKLRSVNSALLGKEFRRFLGSANYMLNCGLGVIIMIIAAVVLLVKADFVRDVVNGVFMGNKDFVSLMAVVAICTLSSMNDITAPSVSLEGKNLWIVQSFPVSGLQVLMAKVKMHLLLTIVPAAILVACVELVILPAPVFAILIPIVAVAFILFMALFGLALNLKMPNLTWTSEIVPIKQSIGVMIALFGGWAFVVGFAGLYYLLRNSFSPTGYLSFVSVLLLAASMVLLRWIRTRGVRIFETL